MNGSTRHATYPNLVRVSVCALVLLLTMNVIVVHAGAGHFPKSLDSTIKAALHRSDLQLMWKPIEHCDPGHVFAD